MDNEHSPNEKAIVPIDGNRQLALPSEIVNRGLDIAARVEYQRNIQLYQKPISSFAITNGPGFIDFSKNAKFVAIVEAQSNPRLFIVDIDNNGKIQSLSSLEQGLNNLGYMGGGSVWSMAISNNGEWTAVGYDDADILCWDVKNKCILSREIGDIWREPVSCLKFFPNDKCYAAYGGYNHLNVHDIRSAKYLYPIPCHLNSLHALAFTDDGCKLLMGGSPYISKAGLFLEDVNSNRNILSQMEDRQEGLSFKGSEGKTINAVAIFPGNKKVLSLDRDSTITIWDATCGEEILQWHHARLTLKTSYRFSEGSVAISPDGRRILSAGGDTYMRLWTVDGDEICEYPHDSQVMKVAFLPDGQHALSGCAGSISLWKLP
jgi:WD40 repeat protein